MRVSWATRILTAAAFAIGSCLLAVAGCSKTSEPAPAANAQPSDPVGKDGTRYSVEDQAPVQYFKDQDGQKIGVTAGRRTYPDRTVPFVNFQEGLVSVSEADARSLVRYLKEPTAGLPADAVKRESGIVGRRVWRVPDVFGRLHVTRGVLEPIALTARFEPASGQFFLNFGAADFKTDAAEPVAALNRVLKDLDTLKALPTAR